MGSALQGIPWGECLLESDSGPPLERRTSASARSAATGGVRYFASVPWVADALRTLNRRLMTRTHLPHELADLAGLVISQDNSCRYCYAAQRALLRILGYSEAQITGLEQDLALGGLSARERLAIDYARRVARGSPLAEPADAEPLRSAGFTEPAIRELASQAALHTLFNRASTLAALPPQALEALPDRWWARLLRPLLGPFARRVRHRARPEPLPKSMRDGSYAAVVVALDGLPIAAELRAILDDMDGSTILSRRCKALVFAVVGRALGCEGIVEEATGQATQQGASPSFVRDVVEHLSSPELDTRESVLVPFARETVWYEAPRLQERARALRTRLSREEFVEAIAVLSLANAVARLAGALRGR